MSVFAETLSRATALDLNATTMEAELKRLRFERDEAILVGLYEATSVADCLSLKPISSQLHQKWLVSLLTIRLFDTKNDRIDVLNSTDFPFWVRDDCWGYSGNPTNSFQTAYNQHRLFRTLLSNLFDFEPTNNWSDWYDFLYEQAKEASKLHSTKRWVLISQMDLAALDMLHKSMHWQDEMLVTRFEEILDAENIKTAAQLKSFFEKRPKRWMLSLLERH